MPQVRVIVSIFALGMVLALADSRHPATAQQAGDEAYASGLFRELQYRMVGPSRGGRVTAVTGDASRPGTFYMGATGGGVWKTTDFGVTWSNVSDGYFASPSIGSIRVAPSNSDVVYVGTGSDGIRSNVIVGRGVYRSADAGRTWAFRGLRDVGQIGAVLVHPTDPDLVYVAAIGHAFGPNPERGVYRSKDGGESWDRVLFVSDSTGAVDLEFAPDNPRTVYASMWRVERKPWTIISGAREGGVYRSTDGGDHWTHLTNGLPSGLIGKSDLAVSPADPNRLYVLIEAAPGGGLYLSTDRGDSFALVSTQSGILNRPFYYTNVDADPTDADVVYVNNEAFYKSTDGGRHFQRRSTPHGDNHDMWIDPNDPDVFIQSNDGGANVTRDGGGTWSTQNNQPTAELYQVDVDNAFPYWLYAGQQDASTIAVPSLPPYSAPIGTSAFWRDVGGCETGPAVPKPDDPNIVFANCKGRFGRYDKVTGQEQQYYVGAQSMYGYDPADLIQRFQRVSPITISPHDPNTVYHASQYLHVTHDGGVTWETISPDLTAFTPETQGVSGEPITRDITGEEFYSTIYAVEESPRVAGVIWVGANDGPVHVTRDGGRTWTDVTPPDLAPGGRVQNIEPSPHSDGKAYIAVNRHYFDDFQPYIYRTTDYGQTWTRLTTGSNGIPADYPTRVVREDREREGLLYAGTEFGMFISFDDGAHWRSFQQNLPITPVTDIAVHQQDLVLSTMGRSFWILDDITPLRELTPTVVASNHLFQPRDAYRMRYSSFGRSPADPQYAPVGAVIDYYLATNQERVEIEILGEDGEVVRSHAAVGQRGQEGQQEQVRQMGQMGQSMGGGFRTPNAQRPSAVAGLHRFVWDLRYPGTTSATTGRALGSGPMAVPGRYRVRITAGDWSETRDFTVLIDPRVAAAGVTQQDLEEQLALNLEIRDALSEARRALYQTENALEETQTRDRERRQQLEAIRSALATADDIAYPQPMLVDQIQYIYSMTSRADQRPGHDAHVRFAQLRSQLDTLLTRLGPLVETR